MYLLDNFTYCTDGTLEPILNIIGIIIRIIWFGVPIVLIILGSIDLGKAVIQSKEDEVKKAKQAFIRRLIYAVLVFAVVWLVTVIMNFITNIGVTNTEAGQVDTKGWKDCWNEIMN